MIYDSSGTSGYRPQTILPRCSLLVSQAMKTLQNQGLNEGSVQEFKDTIQNMNQTLSEEILDNGDPVGRINTQIAQNQDLISLVDILVKYSMAPTEDDRNYLRGLALNDGKVRDFIMNFMNQQSDDRFRF